MTLLVDRQIRKHLEWGSIVIDPFRADRLNTDSYDLELGPWFYRYAGVDDRIPSDMKNGYGFELVDGRKDGGIWLNHNERVLGHSVEIAGGRVSMRPANWLNGECPALGDAGVKIAVTTSLHATSTAARHGISACMCAGWGDVSYVSIWTFEITSHAPGRTWLPVGSIISQIAFMEVQVPTSEYGDKTGNYVFDTLVPVEIRKKWTPEDMLPKPLKVRDGWKEFYPG